MTLPLITNDSDWLDLKDNQKGLVRGYCEFVVSDGITVSFADWSQLMIDTPSEIDLIDLLDEEIELVVTRTEDGVFADAQALKDALRKVSA